MAATNFVVNQEDDRLQTINNEKDAAVQSVTSQYNNMIDQSQKFYDNLAENQKQYAETQQNLQNQRTDQAIAEINQNKDILTRDYEKEQKAAYTDYQKQIDKYGVNAEQMASQGLSQSGFAASADINAYNAYQSRYATARQGYNDAIQKYNNDITNARLANSAALAEIAFNAQEAQLKLALEGFQYNNTLLTQMMDKQAQTEDRYYQRWSDMLGQINFENQQNEAARQYEQNYAEQVRQYNASLAEQQRQYNETKAEQIRQYNETMAFNQQKAAQEQANWEKEYALAKAKASSSSSSSKSGSSNPYASTGNSKITYTNFAKDNGSFSYQGGTIVKGSDNIYYLKKGNNYTKMVDSKGNSIISNANSNMVVLKDGSVILPQGMTNRK